MRHPVQIHSNGWRIRWRGAGLGLLASSLGVASSTCHAGNEAARSHVRAPAVAGQFYPGDAARLAAAVRAFLAEAVPARGDRPLILIVPHAGYAFSGQIAADGFRQTEGQTYDLVVVLGTNHTAAGLRGAALYPLGGFRTPLGVVEIDSAAARDLLAACPDVHVDPGAHEREHSIEVELPFLQVTLPRTRILPLVVGADDPEMCARLGAALGGVLAKRRALVVASSDLAHYPAYADARASDRAVLAAIARLDPGGVRDAIAAQMRAGRDELVTCACGEAPVLVALHAARGLGATRGTVLSCANSGDTALGERGRVVGYGAIVGTAATPGADVEVLSQGAETSDAPLTPADKKALLAFARHSIDRLLATQTPPLARGFAPSACRKQGAFVTLREDGQLRGCVGHMEEDLPLVQVVGAMAIHAAVNDSRFEPLTAAELPRVELEISVLTPLQEVPGPEAIVLGEDGVEIRKSGRAAVFLPQVAVEQGWDRTALLDNLCLKAGLPEDAWRSGARFRTFHSIIFHESDLR